MTISVAKILNQAHSSKEHNSPVDIVMGEDWGDIKLGNSLRLSLLGLMLKKQKELGKSIQSGRSPALAGSHLRVVSRAPQAMVKVIRNGGTINARGMRDQMNYLSKDGDADLQRSERYFGSDIINEDIEPFIEAWENLSGSGTSSDKTTHFVVSFPNGTDHGVAYRAGRAWADELFASGEYGDVFDYYTAFHTDKAHPHMHVVVNRRGLENGDWLKVSRRSEINYDELRAVQVMVAEREGIILDASHRYARGVTSRPTPDGEIRTADRECRAAQSPDHTPLTTIRTAANIALYAQYIEADAKIIAGKYPELSKSLKAVAETIRQGDEIKADLTGAHKFTTQETRQQSEYIMERREEILAGIKEIDSELEGFPSGVERTEFEKEVSSMKADAAELIPDTTELQGYLEANDNGYYHGVDAEDLIEKSIKTEADIKVAELALVGGLDQALFLSRYNSNQPASESLAATWRDKELNEISEKLRTDENVSSEDIDEAAMSIRGDIHNSALNIYRHAERELGAHTARKRQLLRMVKLVNQGKHLDENTEDNFRQTIKSTLHTDQLRQLEAGNSDAFLHVSEDVDARRLLTRRYLENEIEVTDGSRKLQLQTAMAKLDRDTDLAAQEARKLSRNDHGMDR